MKKLLRTLGALCVCPAPTVLPAHAQLDPAPRQLLQIGANTSLHDDGPLGAYAFYYWNMPDVPTTNTGLRLAIAPVFVDGELGFKKLLSEHTDVGLGFFGGLYANSYNEVDGGNYRREESFQGNGGGGRLSIYHLFNPDDRIPLNGMLRGQVNYKSFQETDDTASKFDLPDNQPVYTL